MGREPDNRKLLRRIPRAEREEVGALIRSSISEEHLAQLREDIEADPDGWSVVYHFAGGKEVRNLLRLYGFGEKWSRLSPRHNGGDIVLDRIWAPLVELATFGDAPLPTERKIVRRPAESRLRARHRAYGKAARAMPAEKEDPFKEWACTTMDLASAGG